MAKKGLLLLNLGSPRAPEPPAVREYLNEFLTDPYVIDLPWGIRHILVRRFISPKRSFTTAEAYRQIWLREGSPLVQFTKSLAEKVQRLTDFDVRWGMRYGTHKASDVLKTWEPEELILVPLYPQYAESSTRTGIEDVEKHLSKRTKLKILRDFFDAPEFINSEAQIIQEHLNEFKPDHLLLSFHGLPEHHLKKLYRQHCAFNDDCCAQVTEANRFCYRAQCFQTARLIKSRLRFEQNKISIGFQSRLGNRPWIKPFTDQIVDELAASGCRRLSVACPSFIADCLETLEEIQVRLK
ncbi:MAG: ferrochelatase, partial [Pseudobdellovibrionaceae bacterium]